MDEINALAVAHYACPRCGVQPGEECRTRSGGRIRTTWQHTPRVTPLREAWYLGFSEARSTLLGMALDRPDALLRMARSARERGEA